MTSNNYCVILKSRKEESGFGKRPEDPAALERSAAALLLPLPLERQAGRMLFQESDDQPMTENESYGDSDDSFMLKSNV